MTDANNISECSWGSSGAYMATVTGSMSLKRLYVLRNGTGQTPIRCSETSSLTSIRQRTRWPSCFGPSSSACGVYVVEPPISRLSYTWQSLREDAGGYFWRLRCWSFHAPQLRLVDVSNLIYGCRLIPA